MLGEAAGFSGVKGTKCQSLKPGEVSILILAFFSEGNPNMHCLNMPATT